LDAPETYLTLDERFGELQGIVTLNYDMVPEHLFAARGIDYGFRRKDLLIARDFHREPINMRPLNERNFQKLRDAGAAFDQTEVEEMLQWFSQYAYHRIDATHNFVPGPFPVLKVHGGMNICHCPKCDRLIVFPPWLRRVGHKQWDYPGYEFGWARSGGHDAAFHCVKPTGKEMPPNMEPDRLRPMAIPPVKDKTRLQAWELMKPVQDRAVDLVSKSERLVVIGTSMRKADGILWDCVRAAAGDVQFIGDPKAFGALRAVHSRAEFLGREL
jgi:hypothetical protein